VSYRQFNFLIDSDLPRLAWCARVERLNPRVDVRCGPWVESCDDAFYEGAWAGKVDQKEFDTATTSLATGARLLHSGLVFSTPTHTTQPIYSARRGNTRWFSNSLTFLLTESGISLREDYPYYESDIITIMFGLQGYRRYIPGTRGSRIFLHYHCNVIVGADFSVSEVSKHRLPPPSSYDVYVTLLRREVAAVVANATSSARRHTFEPLSTISSGYDSPACSVIAREAGCSEAFTFTKARSEFTSRSDSGKAIGEALGLKTVELDIDVGLADRHYVTEAEFISTGYGGDDVIMSAAESLLERRLLFTGTHGDKIWDRHCVPGGDTIVRGDPSGSSLAEFRLRVGFVVFPVPFIGATRYSDIVRIAQSAAMREWSVNSESYDRPIPRRIVESAGIPRMWFGQSKKAIATTHHRTDGTSISAETIYSGKTMALFLSFMQETRRATFWLRVKHCFLYVLIKKARIGGILGRIGGPERVRFWVKHLRWRYSTPFSESLWLFHWAVPVVAARYRPGVDSSSDTKSG